MKDQKAEISHGVTVTIAGLPGKYQVSDGPNKRGEYYLVRGVLGIWVTLDKIRLSSAEFPALRSQKSIKRKNSKSEEKRERLDLHAKTVVEATALLERHLSQALINGTTVLEIIHGFGSGKIRTAVHSYLSGSKHVAKFELDSANSGVTLAYLV